MSRRPRPRSAAILGWGRRDVKATAGPHQLTVLSRVVHRKTDHRRAILRKRILLKMEILHRDIRLQGPGWRANGNAAFHVGRGLPAVMIAAERFVDGSKADLARGAPGVAAEAAGQQVVILVELPAKISAELVIADVCPLRGDRSASPIAGIDPASSAAGDGSGGRISTILELEQG